MAFILVNGEPGTAWPVSDRGLQFGDGLFETMLCRNGRAVHFADHWQRLLDGCARLGLACPDVRSQVTEAIRSHAGERAVAKLIVTRGSSQRGYRCPDPARANWTLTVCDAPPVSIARQTEGVALHICQTRLASDPQLAGIKHLNRLAQVLARREWADEFHDGIMLDYSERVVECCASNVFFVRRGQVITPDLSHAGVWGIARRRVLDLCAPLGIEHAVREVGVEEVIAADEVFVTNSVFGVVPVRSVGAARFLPGPVTQAIVQHFEASPC